MPMPYIDYGSPEYSRMVAWTIESLDPYILQSLIPQYANAFFHLVLEPGREKHTRQIKGTNATANRATRAKDLDQFGSMTGKLASQFGRLLWMSKYPSRERDGSKIIVIRQSIGANSTYKW